MAGRAYVSNAAYDTLSGRPYQNGARRLVANRKWRKWSYGSANVRGGVNEGSTRAPEVVARPPPGGFTRARDQVPPRFAIPPRAGWGEKGIQLQAAEGRWGVDGGG